MDFVIMGYGPFRFSLSSYTYDELKRKASARIEEVKIIHGRPSLHKAGLDTEQINLTSVFHPRLFEDGSGLFQMSGLRSCIGQTMSLVGNRVSAGDVFGPWALKSMEDTHTEIFLDGIGQAISVEMELLYDGRSRSLAAASAITRLLSR